MALCLSPLLVGWNTNPDGTKNQTFRTISRQRFSRRDAKKRKWKHRKQSLLGTVERRCVEESLYVSEVDFFFGAFFLQRSVGLRSL